MSKQQIKSIKSKTPALMALVIALVIAVVGLFVLQTLAEMKYGEVQAESGSLSSRAVRIVDASASGGAALQFKDSSEPPTTGIGCLVVPSSCGYPDETNTGVPLGTSLVSSGGFTITEPGMVIDGLNVVGCIDVNAPNVIIKNSKVTCGRSSSSIRIGSEGSVLIQDTDIDGAGTAGNCVGSARFILLRVNLYNCTDGVRANGTNPEEMGVTIRYSYLHDLARVPSSHNDTIQTTQGTNIIIEHNTLFPYRQATNDPMNAAYIVSQDQGTVTNVRVHNNLMNGGNYTMMIGDDIQGLVVTNNVFGRDYRYGPISGDKSIVDSSNIYVDTRLPVLQ